MHRRALHRIYETGRAGSGAPYEKEKKMGWIAFLIVGLVAGWLAGQIMKGRGAGLIVNLVVGVVGSYVGAIAFSAIGFSAHGFIGHLITATAGAVILLFVVGLLKKPRRR
jgi:uncharacterized membrane protein YeaQ/YmgE (transglycosylase-associated protein family)